MSKTLLIKNARVLVTMDDERREIANGAVFIRDNVIEQVGASADLPQHADEIIERVIERDSPTWTPRWVDGLVGDRIHRELMDCTDKVRRNPDHELRKSATKFLFEFADDLQNDEATIARAEAAHESPGDLSSLGAHAAGLS